MCVCVCTVPPLYEEEGVAQPQSAQHEQEAEDWALPGAQDELCRESEVRGMVWRVGGDILNHLDQVLQLLHSTVTYHKLRGVVVLMED